MATTSPETPEPLGSSSGTARAADPPLRRRYSIRTHLFGLVLAVALPMGVLLAWNLYAAAEMDIRDARNQVRRLAEVTASETTTFLEQAGELLTGMARRPEVRAFDRSRCDPFLTHFETIAPRISNVVTLSMDGRVICSAAPTPPGTVMDRSKMLDFLTVPGQVLVGRLTPGTITGRWSIPIGVAISDGQGGMSGAVGLAIDMAKLPLLPRLQGLPAEANVGILDGQGRVLAHSRAPSEMIGQDIRAADGVAQILRERSGTLEAIGLQDEPRIFGFVPIQGTDWIAIASVPSREVLGAIRNRIVFGLLLSLLVVALALWLAVGISQRIGRPVIALAASAARVATGDRGTLAPIAGPSEISDVASDFNSMLLALDRADLERGRLQQIVESTPDFIAIADLDGNLLYVNGAGYRLLGMGPQDSLKGRTTRDVYAPEQWTFIRETARPEAMRNGFWIGESELLEAGAKPLQVSQVLVPLRNRDGKVDCFAGISRDLSEIRRVQSSLAAERQHFETIFYSAPIAIAITSIREGRIVEVNDAYCRLFGIKREMIVGRLSDDFDLGPAERRAGLISRMRAEGPLRNVETVWRTLDGRTQHVLLSANFIEYFGESCVLSLAFNITKRIEAEHAQRDSALQLRKLARRLAEAEELERRSINRELHDRVGQNLAALSLSLSLIRARLMPRAQAPVQEMFDEAQKLLRLTTIEVRNVMADLHPPALEDYGLWAALRDCADTLSVQSGQTIELEGNDLATRPTASTELAILRIAQGAMVNAVKHAQASSITVRLSEVGDGMRLIVHDDGKGFDRARALPSEHRWGLTIMRERAQSIGATLVIESAPGQGCTVSLEWTGEGA